MEDEPLRVMIARIEERQIAQNEKLDSYHTDVQDQGKVLLTHEKALTRINRDRKWERGIIGMAFTAVIAWFKHQ